MQHTTSNFLKLSRIKLHRCCAVGELEAVLFQRCLNLGLIKYSIKPTIHIDEWLLGLSIQQVLIQIDKGGENRNVSKGHSLPNQERLEGKILIQGRKAPFSL